VQGKAAPIAYPASTARHWYLQQEKNREDVNILEGTAGQDVVACGHAPDPDNSAFDTHSILWIILHDP